MSKSYYEKLKDPRWQKKRLEIMERDKFSCQFCYNNESTLNVHHFEYNKDPWDVDDDQLVTLCENCHSDIKYYEKLITKTKIKIFSHLSLLDKSCHIDIVNNVNKYIEVATADGPFFPDVLDCIEIIKTASEHISDIVKYNRGL